MPKSHFSIESVTALSSLAPDAQIHVIGVCGVAMAQLAVTLSECGYRVSGSDKAFYEPMGSLLRGSTVDLFDGFAAENIPENCALVIIGNAVSYDNPEVLASESRRLPYSLFPKIMYETVIEGRHSIAACGTHGKSTTAAMLACVLNHAGLSPSYFIGGIVHGFERSLARGSGDFSVVEGDEYDSAFFAKTPKFHFYKPSTCVITSIEYDHADIYPNIDAINAEFCALVDRLASDGAVIACTDDENIRSLMSDWCKSAAAQCLSYGTSSDADFQLVSCTPCDTGSSLQLRWRGGETYSVTVPFIGQHNALNALATLIVATARVGLSFEAAAQALQQFKGVKRRQEIRYSAGPILIEDFAHHPTSVRETIQAVKSTWPDKRLWAVFEPRSNTSRMQIFKEDYVQSFAAADRVVLCEVTARGSDDLSKLIDVNQLASAICENGTDAAALPSADSIFSHLKLELQDDDLVLVMSNGAFGGLPQKLVDWLKSR